MSRAECSKKVRKCLSCREVVEDKQILVRALPSRIASQSSPLSDTLLLLLFTFTNPSHHTSHHTIHPLDFSPSTLTYTHSSLSHSPHCSLQNLLPLHTCLTSFTRTDTATTPHSLLLPPLCPGSGSLGDDQAQNLMKEVEALKEQVCEGEAVTMEAFRPFVIRSLG